MCILDIPVVLAAVAGGHELQLLVVEGVLQRLEAALEQVDGRRGVSVLVLARLLLLSLALRRHRVLDMFYLS